MNVVLIQPLDPVPPVQPLDSSYGEATSIAPAWDALCVRAFLLNRTRHTCHFVDARLLTDFETHLVQAVERTPKPRLAAIYATMTGLGQAAQALHVIKSALPETRTVLFGPAATHLGLEANHLPNCDFSVCGDAEPVLRDLADSLDAPLRLQRVPGLVMRGKESVQPYWLSDLRSGMLPDLQGVLWDGYRLAPPRQGSWANMRLTRGNTGTPADRAFGGAAEPFRAWPLDRMAACLQKSGSVGIVETFIADPPGVWTPAFLRDWLLALDNVRNTRPWSMQTLPKTISEDTLQLMRLVGCQRVEFLFPSCRPEVLAHYGCELSLPELSATISRLQNKGIEAVARFWVGGPEGGGPQETQRPSKLLAQLGFIPFSLHAFPVEFDSRLYAETPAEAKPSRQSFLAWSRNPWSGEKPLALWGQNPSASAIQTEVDEIYNTVARSPKRHLLQLVERFRNWTPIETIEGVALSMIKPSARRP